MWLLWISHKELFVLAAAWGKASGMKQCTCLKAGSPKRPKIQNLLIMQSNFFCCCIFYLKLACWSKGCRLTLREEATFLDLRIAHLRSLNNAVEREHGRSGSKKICYMNSNHSLNQKPLFSIDVNLSNSDRLVSVRKKKNSTSIENKCIKLRAWQTGAPKPYNRKKQTKNEINGVRGKCDKTVAYIYKTHLKLNRTKSGWCPWWKNGQEKTRLLPRPRLNPEPFSVNVCSPQVALYLFKLT